MGKIFGISDNPVSTIGSVIKPFRLEVPNISCVELPKNAIICDKFVAKENKPVSNPFIKMRNGIGRLMKHFSHPKN